MSAQRYLFAEHGRLRAAWRVLLFLAFALVAYVLASVIGGALESVAASLGARLVVFSWVGLGAVLLATLASLFWVEGTSWDFVLLGHDAARPARLVAGALIGAAAIGIPSAILLLADELRLAPSTPGNWWAAAWRSAVVLLPAALTEELLVRGYVFAVVRQSAGWKWALIGTSVTFGMLHLSNPGVSAQSVLLVITAGFFIGMIALVTNSLYAAWMAHFAWNFVMAGLLHTPVSGLAVPSPNYRVLDNGPDWLTGGMWGPEGGVAAGIGMFTFIFYLYGRHLRRLEQ